VGWSVIVSGACNDADDGECGQRYYKSTVLPVLTKEELALSQDDENFSKYYKEVIFINNSKRYNRWVELYAAIVPRVVGESIKDYRINFKAKSSTDSDLHVPCTVYITMSDYKVQEINWSSTNN
jgi:hypothetical protein